MPDNASYKTSARLTKIDLPFLSYYLISLLKRRGGYHDQLPLIVLKLNRVTENTIENKNPETNGFVVEYISKMFPYALMGRMAEKNGSIAR